MTGQFKQKVERFRALVHEQGWLDLDKAELELDVSPNYMVKIANAAIASESGLVRWGKEVVTTEVMNEGEAKWQTYPLMKRPRWTQYQDHIGCWLRDEKVC